MGTGLDTFSSFNLLPVFKVLDFCLFWLFYFFMWSIKFFQTFLMFFFTFFLKLWSKTVAVGHFLDSPSVSVVSVFDCSDIFTGGGVFLEADAVSRWRAALFLPSALRFRWLYRVTRFPSWAAGKNLQPDPEALQDFPLNPVASKIFLKYDCFSYTKCVSSDLSCWFVQIFHVCESQVKCWCQ